eukprot:sb/3472819/
MFGQVAARLAAEEEELEEFRMLEQAAADKSINTLLGMLGDQNRNSIGVQKLPVCASIPEEEDLPPPPSQVFLPPQTTLPPQEMSSQLPVPPQAISSQFPVPPQATQDDDDDDFDDTETWGFGTPRKGNSLIIEEVEEKEIEEDGDGVGGPSKLLGSLFPG